MAIARHCFASSALVADDGWVIGKYTAKASAINAIKLFANFII